MHVKHVSTLPLPHILIKTVSQVTIPPRIIATIPTAFNGIPKPNCHYSLIKFLIQHELQQHILVVPVLKIFGEKLPLQLLCMIVNTSTDEIVLHKNRNLGEMKPLSNTDDTLKPLVINEVTYAIDSDQVDTPCMQSENFSYNQHDPTLNQNLYQKSQF